MVSTRPKIYVRDTPGMLPMSQLSNLSQVRLAAANLFPIDQIPHRYVQVADYQLFCLNQRENWHRYMEFAGISLPTDNIHIVLQGNLKTINSDTVCDLTDGKVKVGP